MENTSILLNSRTFSQKPSLVVGYDDLMSYFTEKNKKSDKNWYNFLPTNPQTYLHVLPLFFVPFWNYGEVFPKTDLAHMKQTKNICYINK